MGSARIDAFDPSDINSNESREELIDRMMDALIALFPDVDIRFTIDRPFAGQFSRVHVGGRNFTGRSGVLGIAPLDLGNRSGSDILFVFSTEFKRHTPDRGFKLLVQAIAHEIAHSLGARHIENEEAIMNPFAVPSASSFDKSGFVVGEPDEVEHSLDVLINSAGSLKVAQQERELPVIVDVAAFASNGVIQYSVISQSNMAANPNKNLSDYRYIWKFEGRETEGSSVLMTLTIEKIISWNSKFSMRL